MADMAKWVHLITQPIVVSAIVSGLITGLFGVINNKWKKKQEINLESMKGEICKQQVAINNIATSTINSYQIAQQRRLDAIDRVWECVIYIKSETLFICTFYEIFRPDEYNQQFKNPKCNDAFKNITKSKLSIVNQRISVIEAEKLYLGKDLWQLSYTYYRLFLRIYLQFSNMIENEQIYNWSGDVMINDILAALIKDHIIDVTLKEIYNKGICYIRDALEEKIMEEAENIISGKRAGENTYNNIKDVFNKYMGSGI
ncbi:MAG: hypothetical protein AB9856_03010 [Cellulosilyticaceae bacterium]